MGCDHDWELRTGSAQRSKRVPEILEGHMKQSVAEPSSCQNAG